MDLPDEPISTRSGPSGDTVITTFNLCNLFPPSVTPADHDQGIAQAFVEVQVAKLSLAIRQELRLPPVIVVQEVGGVEILRRLAAHVNRHAPPGTRYEGISLPCSDRRGIEVGFLWDEARCGLSRAWQLEGPRVEAAFGPDSPSPGREPLVGVFHLNGQEVMIVANHFKSDHVPASLSANKEQMLRVFQAQRRAQAQVVRDFATQVLTENVAALLMVAGDLNYSPPRTGGDPTNSPLRILAGSGQEPPLANLLPLKGEATAYTFRRNGAPETLDHIFVSEGLRRRFAGIDVLHFNAASPHFLHIDPSTPRGASDHDPVEARFWFAGTVPFPSSPTQVLPASVW